MVSLRQGVFMGKYSVTFAFCTSRKRRVFLAGDIPNAFTSLSSEALTNLDIDVNDIRFYDYGVAMSVEAPPNMSPESIVTKVKSATSRKIREQYQELWSMPALWTKAYWYKIGTLDDSALIEIKDFFDKQPTR